MNQWNQWHAFLAAREEIEGRKREPMGPTVMFHTLEVGDTFLDPNTDEPYVKRSTSVAKCLDPPGLEVVFNDADEVHPTEDPAELYK